MVYWVGGSGNDRRDGTAGADQLLGMQGNDTLNGLGGNDILDGSIGNDVVNGGAGHDVISIMGSDRLTGGGSFDFFTVTGTPVNLRLASNSSVITDFKAAGPGHDFLQLFNFNVRWADRDADMGDRFAITASGASDTLVTIADQAGNTWRILLKDVRPGALTTNNVQLGASFPFAEAPADPWFGTEGDDFRRGGAGDDLLIGDLGNDTLLGMRGDDQLNGQKGADRLFGGGGADRIYLGGLDRAAGGDGADTFVLLSHTSFAGITDSGRAVITDFDDSRDRLEIVGFDVEFADGDPGLEDGFAIRQIGADTHLRFVEADDSITTLVLKNTDADDLTAAHFNFVYL